MVERRGPLSDRPEREVFIRCKTGSNECMCFLGKARPRVGSNRVAGPDYGPRDARLIYSIAYRLRALREVPWILRDSLLASSRVMIECT